MTDLNDMMVFRSVVKQGSFTAAADLLGLPKSNISRKVSRLEAQLGTRLLERSTRALHLTEIGGIYYEHCSRIAEEISNAEKCIDALSAEPRGWIKLSSSVTLGQSLLTPQIAGFSNQYPKVHLDMNLTNRRVDIIEEGFDLIIRAGESPDSNLISKKICSANLNLYASPDYLQKMAHYPVEQPEDLLKHQCLYMNAVDNNPRWQLSSNSGETHLNLEPHYVCNDFASLHQLVLAGMGITLLPEYLCTNNVKEQQLVRVLDTWFCSTVNIYAIYPSRKGVAPKLRALLDYLEESL